MAQDHVWLLRSIWGDEDWRALTPDAQHLYLMLLSHPDRNAAGVVPLTVRKWTRLAATMDVADVERALLELDDSGFVVLDDDTQEVLVRSYIRRAEVYKHIRLLALALREAGEVESERLRSALGQELVRLPRLAIPVHNERMKTEAEAAQLRLDELASMLCDAPPDGPGHGMPHGMSHGIAHPPVVGVGAVAGEGAGAVLGSTSTREDLESLESDARTRDGRVIQGRWSA